MPPGRPVFHSRSASACSSCSTIRMGERSMSMGFPDYEQIRVHSKWLGRIWIVGDVLYYIGLLGGILTFIFSFVSVAFGGLAWLFDFKMRPDAFELKLAPVWLILAVIAGGTACGAWRLKRFAR